MQKIFNACGCLGFVISGAMLIGAGVFYTRIPSLTKLYISELKLELAEMVTDMLPGQIDEAMPGLPTSTGPAMPITPSF